MIKPTPGLILVLSVFAAACNESRNSALDSATGELPDDAATQSLDAGLDASASRLDGAGPVSDGSADATALVDAAPSPACFYPHSLPDGREPLASPGCACAPDVDAGEPSSLCVRRRTDVRFEALYWGLTCESGRWREVREPSCDSQVLTSSPCQGEQQGTSADYGCQPGYYLLSKIESGGLCCARLSMRLSECVAAGYRAFGDPGDGSLVRGRDPTCPNGKRLRGFISSKDFFEGGLCCEQ